MYIFTKNKFFEVCQVAIQVKWMLKNIHRYHGAGFGIGQGIVVFV